MTLDFVQQIVKFVGGKFRDSLVDHENNENCHPTKITRYTVKPFELLVFMVLGSGCVKLWDRSLLQQIQWS